LNNIDISRQELDKLASLLEKDLEETESILIKEKKDDQIGFPMQIHSSPPFELNQLTNMKQNMSAQKVEIFMTLQGNPSESTLTIGSGSGGRISLSPLSLTINKQTFDCCLQHTFLALKKQRDRAIDLIYKKMSNFVRSRLIEDIEETDQPENPSMAVKSSQLEDLLHYLDEGLSLMSDNLYPSMFKQMLKFIWTSVVKDIKEMIFPSDIQESSVLLTIQQAKKLVDNFMKIRDYFHADGEGLSLDFLNGHQDNLSDLLKLYEKPSNQLIVQFLAMSSDRLSSETTASQRNISNSVFIEKIKDDLTNTQIKPIHIKKILEWRKTDKIAHAFLCELLDPKVHQSQQQLRKKFLLPESELIIDSKKAFEMVIIALQIF